VAGTFECGNEPSGDRIKKNEMGVACSRYEGQQRLLRGFGKEKPEEKRTLVRPRRRWEYNVRMDLQEVGWSMDWIELAQDRG
jgi:hypothetical protein